MQHTPVHAEHMMQLVQNNFRTADRVLENDSNGRLQGRTTATSTLQYDLDAAETSFHVLTVFNLALSVVLLRHANFLQLYTPATAQQGTKHTFACP